MSLLLFMSGCAILARGVFSAPHADGAASRHDMSPTYDDGIRLVGAYDNVQFELPGLALSVKALNLQKINEVSVGPLILVPLPLIPWPPGIIGLFREPPAVRTPLSFEIRLDPEGEDVSFDPMRSVLQTPEGETIKPRSFDGPTHSRGYKTSCGWDVLRSVSALIPLNQFSCFRLNFDTAISAEKSFTLSIQGVERAGQPVLVPLIHLKKGTAWLILTMP